MKPMQAITAIRSSNFQYIKKKASMTEGNTRNGLGMGIVWLSPAACYLIVEILAKTGSTGITRSNEASS